jgi:DNA-binding SARP family transcriptional activator
VSGSRAWVPASGGLCALNATELRELVARLEERVQETGHLAAAPIMRVVEQIAAQWYDEIVDVERTWDAHEVAIADEESTRRALVAVLRTLIELLGLPARQHSGPSPLDPAFDQGVPDRCAAPRAASPTLPEVARGAELAAFLLGPFRLFRRGQPLEEWHGSKTTRVLRFLVAQRGRPVPRDALIDLFWPSTDAESSRRSVHQMIYTIRKSLRGGTVIDESDAELPLIIFENDAYALDVQRGFWCDVTEFERHIAAGRRAETEGRMDEAVVHYEQAQELYRGEFLEDLPYDEWVLADRRHLRMIYIEMVNHLAELRLDTGAIDEALQLSQELLHADPCDESAHRRAMRCYARVGNRAMLTQQYEACADAMERVLGMSPDPKTVELYASLVSRN